MVSRDKTWYDKNTKSNWLHELEFESKEVQESFYSDWKNLKRRTKIKRIKQIMKFYKSEVKGLGEGVGSLNHLLRLDEYFGKCKKEIKVLQNKLEELMEKV